MTATDPRNEAGKAPLIINGLTIRPRGTTKATDSWSPRQKAAGFVALFVPWEIARPFVAIALGMDSLLRYLDAKKSYGDSALNLFVASQDYGPRR